MRYSLFILVFFVFLISCSLDDWNKHHSLDVKSVIDEYSKSIAIEKKVVLRGYGLQYAGKDNIYDGKIHVIDLSYSIDKHMQYDEAREFFYCVVDGLLKRFNETEDSKSVFFHYPVGYEDLFISVSFDYERKGFLGKDEVDQITIFENKIIYHIVAEEGLSEMKQRKVVPNVYILDNYSHKTRAIVKNLPEK